jgi:hypothetical protein
VSQCFSWEAISPLSSRANTGHVMSS